MPDTTTDRELLKLAAKAAGLEWQDELWNESRVRRPDRLWEPWNPLTDDGDAFRLAVALGIGIGIDMQDEIVTAYAPNPSPQHFSEDAHDTDKYAATRRAIVRAAAEVQRAREAG